MGSGKVHKSMLMTIESYLLVPRLSENSYTQISLSLSLSLPFTPKKQKRTEKNNDQPLLFITLDDLSETISMHTGKLDKLRIDILTTDIDIFFATEQPRGFCITLRTKMIRAFVGPSPDLSEIPILRQPGTNDDAMVAVCRTDFQRVSFPASSIDNEISQAPC